MSTELEFAVLEGSAQMNQKPLTEESAENLHWKEERFPARDPARLIGAESATGHHAMNVGMNMQILTPGVQHGQKADCRPQPLGIRRNGKQGLADCAEEDAIDRPGILQRHAADLRGDSEHHVKILDGQQFGFAVGQPLSTNAGLTLGAIAIAAGVEQKETMPALLALLQAAA